MSSHYEESSLSALINAPHLLVGHVLLSNWRIFCAMGLLDPMAQLLGKGNFGSAYRIPHERDGVAPSVLKLTRDVTEVQAAHLLKGKRSKRIAHVYDVWYIDGTQVHDLQGWYAIHRSYLTPLNKRDTALVEAIFHVFGDTELDLVIPRSLKQKGQIQKWRMYLGEFLAGEGSPTSEDDPRMGGGNLAGPHMVERALMLLVQIGEAVDEMHKAGIDWEDVHPDNIMRNEKGTLVIADFGFGLVHEEFHATIPILDRKKAAQIREA